MERTKSKIQAYVIDSPYPSDIRGGSILSSISKLEFSVLFIKAQRLTQCLKYITYYIGFDCPSLNVCTNGIHIPLYENPGCGGTVQFVFPVTPVTATT